MDWARDRGAAVHMDGARLWGCEPFYGRTLAEIAGLFDTVYVSLYKQLGGIAGCCLAGPEDVVAEVREWRRRHGGTLYALWPYAASGLAGLRTRLPRMPAYQEHALAIAEAVGEIPGVEVVPDPPHTPMMHLLLPIGADELRTSALAMAERERIWTWSRSRPTGSARLQQVELEVGDATMGFTPEEFRDVLERLLATEPRWTGSPAPCVKNLEYLEGLGLPDGQARVAAGSPNPGRERPPDSTPQRPDRRPSQACAAQEPTSRESACVKSSSRATRLASSLGIARLVGYLPRGCARIERLATELGGGQEPDGLVSIAQERRNRTRQQLEPFDEDRTVGRHRQRSSTMRSKPSSRNPWKVSNISCGERRSHLSSMSIDRKA